MVPRCHAASETFITDAQSSSSDGSALAPLPRMSPRPSVKVLGAWRRGRVASDSVLRAIRRPCATAAAPRAGDCVQERPVSPDERADCRRGQPNASRRAAGRYSRLFRFLSTLLDLLGCGHRAVVRARRMLPLDSPHCSARFQPAPLRTPSFDRS